MNSEYINTLISNCERAKIAEPVSESVINSKDELQSLHSIKHGIYIIEEIGGNAEKTLQDFATYKSRNERACAKVNGPSNVLYVGSSTTRVNKRLMQHLNEAPKGTYALHMSHWFKGKFKVTIKEFDVERPVLQIIEDAISFDLKPAFGKQGGNNKS